MTVRTFRVVRDCTSNCNRRVYLRKGEIIELDDRHPSVKKWLKRKKIVEIKKD